jgi:hypothetical protein
VLDGLDLSTIPAGKELEVVSLVDRFGPDRAHTDPLACIEEIVSSFLPPKSSS